MSEITLDQKVEFLKNIYLDYAYDYDDEIVASALHDFYNDPENANIFSLATSVYIKHATLTDSGKKMIEKYFDLVSKLDDTQHYLNHIK
jgi:hypothetical protein